MKRQLSFREDLLLSYAIEGRIQPVLAIINSLNNLEVNDSNYMKFRFLQLELIIKQCELMSDIAGYVHSIDNEFIDKNKMIDECYESIVDIRGSDIKDFFYNIDKKDRQYFFNLLGYDLLQNVSVDSEAIDKSIDIVISSFKQMKDFYNLFWPVYNSYKHGYRLFLDKTSIEMVQSKNVTGRMPIDTIIYADPKKKDTAKVIGFNRSKARYKLSYFYILQGIVNAFSLRLLAAIDFRHSDLSQINIPYIKLFKNMDGDHKNILIYPEYLGNIWKQ